MATLTLSTEWQNWLKENILRGCSEDSMAASMTQSGFSATEAQKYIRQFSQELTPEHSNNETNYKYEPSRISTGNKIQLSDKTVTVAIRLNQPDIAVFDDLFSPTECETLINLSLEKLKRSTIVDPDTGKKHVIDSRSSDGCYFQRNENEFIQTLDARIAELMNWPLEHGEGIQVLRYKEGAEYRPHFDYFPPEQPGSAKHLATGGQRVATLVMYLNDVTEGGETQFPSVGISVVPRQGSAAYFSYYNSLGQVDPATLHAGNPVIRGEKWIATKWMRQNPY